MDESCSSCVCSVRTVPRKPESLVSLTSSPMQKTSVALENPTTMYASNSSVVLRRGRVWTDGVV
eukprot:41278-Chlamydomonas_euryale.AAC.1